MRNQKDLQDEVKSQKAQKNDIFRHYLFTFLFCCVYNIKENKEREKIEPIWRPTIFSPVTHTLSACLFLLYIPSWRKSREC